jgi:putative colanic acid biosysnthesis UDP-glucose lipid carrier transferase
LPPQPHRSSTPNSGRRSLAVRAGAAVAMAHSPGRVESRPAADDSGRTSLARTGRHAKLKLYSIGRRVACRSAAYIPLAKRFFRLAAPGAHQESMGLPARHIHQQVSLAGMAYRLADAASVGGGLWLAVQATGRPTCDCLLSAAAAVIVHYLVAELAGMYRSWRGVSIERHAAAAFSAWCVAFLILSGLGFAIERLNDFPRLLLVAWLVATGVLMVGSHVLLRQAQRLLWLRGLNTKGCAIVGVNDLSVQLGRNILDAPELGLKLAGYYDDRPPERGPKLPPEFEQRIGNIDNLVTDARAGRIERIYITFPMRAEDRIRGVLKKLADTTTSVYIVPDFFVFQLLHSRWTDIGGLPAVSIFENPLYGVDGLAKRAFDIAVSGLLLLILAGPMLLIALAVKLASRGPALFRQRRYGLDGSEFFVWKFRTMHVQEPGECAVQATRNDPRVTPLGAVLRRTSLDELPQLFNVLMGSMSLVGPRPHATAHNEQYRKMIEGYMLRHKIKPGITGLAQVRGWRGETDTLEKMQRRVECDHEYIREWSLWLDVKILLQTVLVVWAGKNAH